MNQAASFGWTDGSSFILGAGMVRGWDNVVFVSLFLVLNLVLVVVLVLVVSAGSLLNARRLIDYFESFRSSSGNLGVGGSCNSNNNSSLSHGVA